MHIHSALLFHFAQVPIKSENIKLFMTQPIPDTTINPKSLEVKTAQATGNFLLIILIVFLAIGFIVALFKEPLAAWMRTAGESQKQEESKQASQQEFAVSLNISDVRTEDYFRAIIQGTVYLKIDTTKNVTLLKSTDGIITNERVISFFKDTFESAIREAASSKGLDEIYKNRVQFSTQVKGILDGIIQGSFLMIKYVVIGNVDESNNYDPDNYFDAQALQKRMETIQLAILATRRVELANEKLIETEELEFQKQHLQNNKTLETEKITVEFEIEKYKNSKDNELEQEIETSAINMMKTIEEYKASVEEAIQTAKRKIEKGEINTRIDIEQHRAIEEEKVVIANKALQIIQKQAEQEIEQAEITATITTIQAETTKLEEERLRDIKLETNTTDIEMKQVERENEKTKSIKDNRLENEVAIIQQLAGAEEKRYKAVPISDLDSLIKLIREELLAKGQDAQLTIIKQIVESLAPKENALGNSNVYTFSNSDAEDINKLMFSTSGMHLINSFLNSKLGQQWQNNLTNDNGASENLVEMTNVE
ncbi:SPFH domain-containing protein [Crocosphaera chwakensis]|uniref:Band 7 domain-containing protein n=1 Tax=Crocosphaera chwakensis CCY0110 TaxID=391612 RepID=A3IWY6_9CHRO|nr:SPFH domain-containing protein [Crocosphaera chwakensis]EAZ88985.1 hypothetical protein CY0110_08941 [Crocosphaera chwakensis CCY0110]